MDLKQLLMSLPDITAVSGFESDGIDRLRAFAEPYFDRIELTPLGSLLCYKGAYEGAPTLLLDAHIDEIGMMVSSVCDDGYVRFDPAGGLDRRSLLGTHVVIHAQTRDIPGVIVLPRNTTEGSPEVSDLRIYTGLTASEAKEAVHEGDSVSFPSGALELLGDSISGKAFDNRASYAAILRAMDLLGGDTCGINIVALFSCGEETNMNGATGGSFIVQPDAAIVLDVSFARVPDTSEKSTLKYGEGPAVSFSAVMDRALAKALIQTAEENDLKCQTLVEVMGTGTNADAISRQCGGISTALVSIPLKNMHTPGEVICVRDIEYTAQLIAGFVKGGYLK